MLDRHHNDVQLYRPAIHHPHNLGFAPFMGAVIRIHHGVSPNIVLRSYRHCADICHIPWACKEVAGWKAGETGEEKGEYVKV